MKTYVHRFGDVLRNAAFGDFTLTERTYSPDLVLPEHEHREHDFCFVLAGTFTEVMGNEERRCRPRTVLFHPAGEAHWDHFHTSVRCFSLQFGGRDLDHAPRSQRGASSRSVSSPGGRLSQLAAQLYREFCRPSPVSSLMVEGLALQMIAETSRQTGVAPAAPSWLEEAKQILDEQFGDRPSLVDLAASVGVHPVHLVREFRRFYGCTMSEYVMQRRLDFACRELANSGASLNGIALEAGFFDQSHFARTFKAQIGMSPNQYRATLSEG